MYLQGDTENSKGMGCCYEPGRGISALSVVAQEAIFNHPYMQPLLSISLIPDSIVGEQHTKLYLRNPPSKNMKPVIMTDAWVVIACKQANEKLLCLLSKTETLYRLCEILSLHATRPKQLWNFWWKHWLTFLCLSQGGCEHCGPFPCLLLTAEVEGDAIMWRHRQSQLMALWCFYLITHCPQIKLCNCLRKTEIWRVEKSWCEMQRSLKFSSLILDSSETNNNNDNTICPKKFVFLFILKLKALT